MAEVLRLPCIWQAVSVAINGSGLHGQIPNERPAWVIADKVFRTRRQIASVESHPRPDSRIVVRDVKRICRAADIHAQHITARQKTCGPMHREHVASVGTGRSV